MGLLCGALPLAAQPTTSSPAATPAPTAAPPLLATPDALWAVLSDSKLRELPHRIDLTLTVLLYDPSWSLLWCEIENRGVFFNTTTQPLPLHSGQIVRLTGTQIPALGLGAGDTQIEVIREGALRPAGRLGSEWPDDPALIRRFIEVDAYVDRQSIPEPNHLQLELVVADRTVTGRVLRVAGDPVPDLTGHFVRLRGVWVPTEQPDETREDYALWIPSIHHVLTDAPDLASPWQLPPTAIADLAHLEDGAWLRLQAMVLHHNRDGQLILHDNTGQITVHTSQARRARSGEAVALVGRWHARFTDHPITNAVFRTLDPTQTAAVQPSHKLRVARQVLQLTTEAIRQNLPVTLKGTITYPDPDHRYFYLLDASGSVRVQLSAEAIQDRSRLPGLQSGQAITVVGHAAPGAFAPQVVATSFAFEGVRPVLSPRDVTLEQALTGVEDSQWVSLQGYLHQLNPLEDHTLLHLTTPGGEFTARVDAPLPPSVAPGAFLRLDGVCVAVTSGEPFLETVNLLVPTPQNVEVVEPAREDLFDAPESSLTSLQGYRGQGQADHLAKTRGTVTLHLPGRALWITDGHDSLRALSRLTEPALQPGDVVELVGLPGRLGNRFVLRETQYRVIGHEEPPVAAPFAAVLASRDGDALPDGAMVEVEAELISAVPHRQGVTLSLARGGSVMEATWEASRAEVDASGLLDLRPGSQLRISGLYETEFDEFNRPHDFNLRLRTPPDVVLLNTPTWWTTSRTLAIILLMAAGLGAGMTWVGLLRRRVAAQRLEIDQSTEQRDLLQARFKEVIDQTNDFIFTVDFSGRFTSFNAAGERLTGYTREEAMQMRIYDIIDETAARRTRLYIQRRLNPERSVTFEYQLRTKDGREIEVETCAGFIRQDDRLVGGFGIMRDVSDRKAEERRQKEVEARSVQARKLESLGTLAGGIAHDINNILTTIQGSIDRVAYALPRDSDAHVQVAQINQSSDRARELVQHVLTFSNENEPRRESLLLDDIAREVYRLAKASAPSSTRCALKLPDGPLPVFADAAQLHQLLVNLCSNAWQALPAHGGDVVLQLEEVPLTAPLPPALAALAPGAYARIRISDTGCGMDEATLQRIFDPFFTTKPPGQGTGLGMAVVHTVVENHDGAITLRSAPGQGTTVEVHLPIAAAPASRTPTVTNPEIAPGHGERLLVVDDEPMITLNFEALLSRIGYRVETFTDPVEAWKRFEQGPDDFALVLSDLSMPELSGRDLAKRMLAVRPELPVIIYTGHLESELHDQLQAVKVRRVLRKPAPLAEVARAIADELSATPA
ncbi:hybrid sensor histidine kinase/response regulator [Actomonas aquatica]|uniref:histidine kinase n=1 Tax=Actomonas aquatica TaxID=2866162 RepID=A0ABZ1C8H3_9BACT|nr:PAS domain-containing sensor histidine kinase [Opitutus sp. WL0086]WRQ86859.1 PAS domain S-box protein [Opitutus sp. WL0086]